MDLDRLKETLTQEWQAAKGRYQQAQQAAQEATADALRVEGALKLLVRLEGEQGNTDAVDHS